MEVNWELGPLAPLKLGQRVRIIGDVTWEAEEHGEVVYHTLELGTEAIVSKIRDYGIALLKQGDEEAWVFYEDFEAL